MFALPLLLSMNQSYAQAASNPPPARSILITGFEPFGATTGHVAQFTNNSEEVANLMRRSFAKYLPNIHLEVCILPIEYDWAAVVLQSCLNKMKIPADRILSLGELNTPFIRVEKFAHNLDNEPRGADAKGVVRQNQTIAPGAPMEIALTGFPISDMLSRVAAADRPHIQPSQEMQAYVCNNTAYRVALALDGRIPFLFMHVPDSGAPSEFARIILSTGFWL